MKIQSISNTKVHCIVDFMSIDECDVIREWFTLAPKREIPTNSFYDGRTLDYKNIFDTDIKRRIAIFKSDLSFIIRSVFKETVYPDYTDLVRWDEGQSMDVHADNVFPDGTPNNTPYRNYTALLYLNDNFIGGKTFFPNQKIIIQPTKGTLVFYPSDAEHAHGVSQIISGTRYTLASWFTKDRTLIEV